jgi:spore coat polysaccharide biosynthesis protein SpsF
VLSRYCLAIRRFGPARIIRATADNPFVLTDAASALNEEAVVLDADYALYGNIPHGTGVECVKSEALLKAEKEAVNLPEREHVCPYLYNHPELFRLHRPLAPLRWQGKELNCTVDTKEDYERAQKLYEALSEFDPAERNKGERVISVYRKIFPQNEPS